MDKKVKFSHTMSTSICHWNIYEDWNFRGFPVTTLIRGEVVADGGKLVGKPGYGRYLYS